MLLANFFYDDLHINNAKDQKERPMNALYYHNPKCSKSRAGLGFLQDKNLNLTIKEYLKVPLFSEELLELFSFFDNDPTTLLRKKEDLYKELGLDNKILTLKEWAEVLIKHPQLLERPILKIGNKAAIGRPTENFLTIL